MDWSPSSGPRRGFQRREGDPRGGDRSDHDGRVDRQRDDDPFASKDANGLVVNISGGNLGPTHLVQGGPLTVAIAETTTDLPPCPATRRSYRIPLSIVSLPSQSDFHDGLSIFHDYASLLTNLNTARTAPTPFRSWWR